MNPTEPPTTTQEPSTSEHTTNTKTQASTPTSTTSTKFDKLVALHQQKENHQRQLSILTKHISNRTAPTGLTINAQPWVQLSPKLKEAWDIGIRDCMSHLTTILHQHHTEELTKIQEQISSLSSALTKDLPQEVSSTLIHIASTHKSSHKRKTLPDPTTKAHHKTPTKAPTKRRKTKYSATTPNNNQDFRNQPHRPHHKKQPHTNTRTPPLRIPPHPPKTPTPRLPTPHPPNTTPRPFNTTPRPLNTKPHPTNNPKPRFSSTPPAHHIQHQLVGIRTRFPTIYNMFMKGKQ
jgi:hypothetical protein